MFRCLYVILRESLLLYAEVTKLINWKHLVNCCRKSIDKLLKLEKGIRLFHEVRHPRWVL